MTEALHKLPMTQNLKKLLLQTRKELSNSKNLYVLNPAYLSLKSGHDTVKSLLTVTPGGVIKFCSRK